MKLRAIVYCFHLVFFLLPTFTGKGQNTQNNCTECHGDLIKNEVKHAIAEDGCDNCHLSNEGIHPQDQGKEFALAEEGQGLCYMCHEQKDTKTHVHSPITNGYCWMCHSPHSSPNTALLTDHPVEKVCIKCHQDEIPKTDVVHLPVKEGSCNECHDAHQSDNEVLLKENKPGLCFNCHGDDAKDIKPENVHVAYSDNCSNCHSTHHSEERFLLTQKRPELCFNCHADIEGSYKTLKSKHLVIVDKQNCGNCHNPHASQNNSLLLKEGNALCYGCHNKVVNSEKKAIKNIMVQVKTGKSIHAAIELEGCIACHNPHFSDHQSLLNGSYPENSYVDYSIEKNELCFRCHDSAMIKEGVSKDVTGFRAGERNLHFVHLRGKKGRNCNLCHDVHASKYAHLILEEFRFGKWEAAMNYTENTNGGSCFPGCHSEKTYER